MSLSKKILKNCLGLVLLTLSPITLSNPITCFKSNQGDFCIELFEKQAPKTVANFLRYIESNRYIGTIFHRSVPGFIVQTGGLKINADENSNQIVEITKFETVENEFAISNTRGTVAMAKLGSDPDSATSQWFISLTDNAANLDAQNGGFTVFGQIIDNGMQAIDSISNLPVNQLTSIHASMSSTPTIDFDGASLFVRNLVLIDTIEFIEDNHETTFNNNQLHFPVDIGSNNFFEVTLNLIATEPQIIFELDAPSVRPLSETPLNVATFSAQDNSLTIPSILINNSNIARNVRLSLTNSTLIQFTLVSAE